MASVQLMVLVLALAIAVQEYQGKAEIIRCASQPPCFDLLIMERLAQHVSKYVSGADNDNILLKSKTFDQIRHKKYLHSCVLQKIIDFYKNVLSTVQYMQTGHLELISTLNRVRNCTYKVKGCDRLYQKANRQADLKIAEANMGAQEVAIFQIQKLNNANKNLNDTILRQTAIDELKFLHQYISGNGFRKTNKLTSH